MRYWAFLLVVLFVTAHACGGSDAPLPAAPTPSAIAGAPVAPAGPFVAGQIYFGRNSYVEYRAGDLPLILSAPHGGTLAPGTIPDRAGGTTATDTSTVELVTALASAISQRMGGSPHVVICHLRRTKVDVNREIVEGAQGNPDAEQAWTEYHAYLDVARQASAAHAGRGFYVDLHGHSHPHARTEFGYLLDAGDLAASDAEVDRAGIAARSSIRSLAAEAPVSFAALLRGPQSLGGLLAARGHAAVPSPAAPGPGSDPYYSGGYSTERHGSMNGGPVSAVQVETPFDGVRSTSGTRAAFAAALADSLVTFLNASGSFRLE